LVTLRNLTVRNFLDGIVVTQTARVNIDNCRIENNLATGITLFGGGVRGTITNTHVTGSGFRVGAGVSSTPSPGHGIVIDGNAQAKIAFTTVSYNAAAGIYNSGAASNLVIFKVGTYFNAPGFDLAGAHIIAPSPNHAQ
jgi:parallel beta-helix repeat protein